MSDPSFNPLWINTALKPKNFLTISPHSFNPLWINTALKRNYTNGYHNSRFNPLWINTALKRDRCSYFVKISFNPLWINTALKLNVLDKQYKPSFNPLWINTALKLSVKAACFFAVSIPYGLTLLSNLKFEKTTCISLYYSLGNFILNYISHKSRSMIKRLSFAILSYSLFSKKIT